MSVNKEPATVSADNPLAKMLEAAQRALDPQGLASLGSKLQEMISTKIFQNKRRFVIGEVVTLPDYLLSAEGSVAALRRLQR
jgi:hypothetical protein